VLIGVIGGSGVYRFVQTIRVFPREPTGLAIHSISLIDRLLLHDLLPLT